MPSSPFDTRPDRRSIPEAEWRISATLVVDGEHTVITTDVPLRLTDARLNNDFVDAARAIGLWIDDQAQAYNRRNRAKAAPKRGQK